MTELERRTIVVGIVPGQSPSVLRTAARFAERFDAELVCAWVDAARYTIAEEADDAAWSMPIDPDDDDAPVLEASPDLGAAIARALEGLGVRWSMRTLAGGPAVELARLADELDAELIVVGTREAGLRGSLHEFFTGSVAVQLAHRQHRPLLVVPLKPVARDDDLPWRGEDA